jgi:transposase
MARAYSDDLRCKVLAAYAAGKGTLRELAERFQVSYGWVAKIHLMEVRTGSRTRLPQRSRGRAGGIDTKLVRRLVHEHPDIVLRELQQQMLSAGTQVSIAHLARVLRRLDLLLKKSRSTPPNGTAKTTSAVAKRSSRGSPKLRRKT